MFKLAIAGRPNVGKSTLFNVLCGKALAIVHDEPGVTRDWREGQASLGDMDFRLLDTAGLDDPENDIVTQSMQDQTQKAIEMADAVLFIIDGRAGVTGMDEVVAANLRKTSKPVIFAANKTEGNFNPDTELAEAYGLGLGAPIPLSAAHSEGLGDLYEALLPIYEAHNKEHLPEAIEAEELTEEDDEEDDGVIKVAIIGRPNVGKSTLLNAIIQEERMITGPIAGITRDTIHVEWQHKNRQFRLADTAGLRRKMKVTDSVEALSYEETMRAIRLSQVTILVIDASARIDKQDMKIAAHAIEEGRAFIIAANKWDLVDDKKAYLEEINHRLFHGLSQIHDIPVVPLSALNNSNVNKLLDTVLKTYDIWNTRVSTGKLNRWLEEIKNYNPPPMVSGRPNAMRYISQIKSRPPTFALWMSKADKLPESYKKYLMNQIRKDFGLQGIPVRLLVKSGKNPYV